jgi:hypothetical protein
MTDTTEARPLVELVRANQSWHRSDRERERQAHDMFRGHEPLCYSEIGARLRISPQQAADLEAAHRSAVRIFVSAEAAALILEHQ